MFIYWLLILAPSLPLLSIYISYKRIHDQKKAELETRFLRSQELYRAYRNAFGAVRLKEYLENFHNWRTYGLPLVVTGVVAAGFAGVALMAGDAKLGLDPVEKLLTGHGPGAFSVPRTMLAGAAGAYLWGLYDLLERHGSSDLSSTALHFIWLRILLAAALGPLLFGSMGPSVSLAVAFTFGGLPLRQIRRLAESRLGFGTPNSSDRKLLNSIQGMTPKVRERLEDEEIDSVQRLAYADPVRLIFRTNIEWSVILDLIDQALLINFVGEKVSALRSMGVRGAIEIAELYYREGWDGKDKDDGKHAKRMFVQIGRSLYPDAEPQGKDDLGKDAAYNLSYQLANDPLVDFIWEHWMTPYDKVIEHEPKEPKPGEQPNILGRMLSFLPGQTAPVKEHRHNGKVKTAPA